MVGRLRHVGCRLGMTLDVLVDLGENMCVYMYIYLAKCVISCTQYRKLVLIRVHILFLVQNRV